jgi:hypothetical protein
MDTGGIKKLLREELLDMSFYCCCGNLCNSECYHFRGQSYCSEQCLEKYIGDDDENV